MSKFRPLPQGEQELINKLEEVNDKLEDFFVKKRLEFGTRVEKLVSRPDRRQLSTSNIHLIIDEESFALSYRGQLAEEISKNMNRLSKARIKLKDAEAEKTLFYMSGASSYKLNAGQVKIMVESVVGQRKRNCELIESYIEYLRSLYSDLETFAFTIKNTIALLELMGS